jgi:hypothetical protein
MNRTVTDLARPWQRLAELVRFGEIAHLKTTLRLGFADTQTKEKLLPSGKKVSRTLENVWIRTLWHVAYLLRRAENKHSA